LVTIPDATVEDETTVTTAARLNSKGDRMYIVVLSCPQKHNGSECVTKRIIDKSVDVQSQT
jgi:hypothetical protein